jgi:hypothetical protein
MNFKSYLLRVCTIFIDLAFFKVNSRQIIYLTTIALITNSKEILIDIFLDYVQFFSYLDFLVDGFQTIYFNYKWQWILKVIFLNSVQF